jgi:monoterpene epsilon-lactone hydrolase
MNSALPSTPHVLPPGSQSLEMRRAVEQVASFKWPEILPTTNQGWAALRNPEPEATRTRLKALLTKLDLTLEEDSFGGVHCYTINPVGVSKPGGPLLVHLHGGGYVLGAGEAGISEAILLAGSSKITTISVDYRMPPDHPFPVPLDDAMSVWLAVTQRFSGRQLGLSGTSAGGAMVLSLVQRLISAQLARPTAIVAGTPWADLSETGDSYFTNKHADAMVYEGLLSVMARQYANGIDLCDPRISPVYGSFQGFPPTLLLTGTRDLFLSNTVRVDRKIRDEGKESELIVYEGQGHAQYMLGIEVPESCTALNDIARFWKRHFDG